MDKKLVISREKAKELANNEIVQTMGRIIYSYENMLTPEMLRKVKNEAWMRRNIEKALGKKMAEYYEANSKRFIKFEE